MITASPHGGLNFSMHIDELLLTKMPNEVLAIASAQLAAELVEHVGKKMLEEMDPEELTRQVHRRVIDELANGFEIRIKSEVPAETPTKNDDVDPISGRPRGPRR